MECDHPLKIIEANNGKIYAYGSGTIHVTTSVDGVKHEADLEDVCYAPDVHM